MIRSAGNTYNPCLLALRAKGYELTLWFTIDRGGEYQSNWDAQLGEQSFSASTPIELLGLVAMWEVRGDNWQTQSDEPYVFDELYPESLTYDPDGKAIERGDDVLP